MSDVPVDPRWPKLLSLTVHEFRTPMTVVAGYIRMVLKERAGPISESQRKLLEEAEKSCGRLSALLAEVSELSSLEGGTATFNLGPIDLHALLAETVAALPPVPDREVHVALSTGSGAATILGDPVRLKGALSAVLVSLRRELVTSNRLSVVERARDNGSASWIAIAPDARAEALALVDPASLATFDEWRGGCGLSLAVARRVIDVHGGRLRAPAEDSKAGAVITLPLA